MRRRLVACAMSNGEEQSSYFVLKPADLAGIIDSLKQQEYTIIGPACRDGAIVYDSIDKLEDLPAGWTTVQEAGVCRLKRRPDAALFGYVPGATSLKNSLHAARLRLFSAERDNGVFRILPDREAPPRYAFLGVRGCDLAAVAVQDKVLIEGQYTDPEYRDRREGIFVVAVHCTEPAPTCFCASMGTGPAVRNGYDVALTELVDNGHPVFLAESGSAGGEGLLKAAGASPAPPNLAVRARRLHEDAAKAQTRAVETGGLKQVLYDSFESQHWDSIARRCLACGNCTMVCPTCFCVTVEDTTDLSGKRAERWRSWDSCFTQNYSYIHGGSVRTSTKSRYRQWLTHKLASWQDQFGMLGCVGCGRCITWCPVGIDLTAEVAALRASTGPSVGTRSAA